MKKQLSLIMMAILMAVNLCWAQTDSMEFATGRLSAQQQLLSYPLPRFKEGNTLNKNFIWFGLNYFSGAQQSGVTNQQMIANAKVNNVEFYNNWNYYFMINENLGSYNSPANYADTVNYLNGAMVAIAKRNPSWKTSAICFWAQIGGNINKSNLTTEHYLRNSSGGYLNLDGAGAGTAKYWSPVAPNASIVADGQKQKVYLQNLTTALGRPLTILNENGEVIPLISRNGGIIDNDPYVRADYQSLGYTLPKTTDAVNDYRGRRYTDQTNLYRDQFMSVSPSTIFTHYGLDGQTDYRPVWSRSKFINTPINGKYYPTGDFYPRWPNNWRAWAGAWHGLGWFADCKYYELQRGDSLMSPFVSAGWNNDETQNMRPAQYLATLKVLSAWGSEFFYSGYFSLSAPFPNSRDWAWQTVMPVYAQAVTSHAETFLRNGTLLTGDVPRYYLSSTTLWPNNPKYLFNTGDNRQLVAVRKINGVEKYLITTAQMVDANTPGNAPMVSYGKFKLGNDSLRVEFRRQGSVYVYDATNSSAKIFYQLDKWHEYAHPERWSKDLNIEAELNDAGNAVTKTSVNAVNDYVGHIAYKVVSTNDTLIYSKINPRAQGTYFIWIKARGLNTGLSLTVGNATHVVNCINSPEWKWYGFNSSDSQMSFVFAGTSQKLSVSNMSSTPVEIDQIYISSNPQAITNSVRCTVSIPVATITPLRPTTFCQGDSCVLQANQGIVYLWSNGATSREIVVRNSGTYAVTVTQQGGSAVSRGEVVTVKTRPVVTIENLSETTTFCEGDSIILQGSGPNFNWTTGATTSGIVVKNTGTYFFTSTNECGTVSSTPIFLEQLSCECDTASNLSSRPNSFPRQRVFSWKPAQNVISQVLTIIDLQTSSVRAWTLSSTTSKTSKGNLVRGRQYSWSITSICENGESTTDSILFIQ